jgi:hypothetical protein
MEHTPESHLHQAMELARQAAAQMRKAANLADQAAQLWQKALAQANQENLSQPPTIVQMSVGSPKRTKKPYKKPEASKLFENTLLQPAEHPVTHTNEAKQTLASPSENAWEDGDDWWKPRQTCSPSDV